MNFCLAVCLLITSYYQHTNPSVKQLRPVYKNAATDKKAAENLKGLLAKTETNAPATIVCYKGVANMLIAKYSSNPMTKFKMFSAGKTLITEAVSRDTLNVETRLLRFTMQYHTPAFLGYRSNLDADRFFLTKNLSHIKDEELKDMVEKMLLITKSD
jgi:hypothetical protein